MKISTTYPIAILLIFLIFTIACEKPIIDPVISNPIEGKWWLGDGAPYYYDYEGSGNFWYYELIDADSPGLGFELQAKATWRSTQDTIYYTQVEIASGDNWVMWDDYQVLYAMSHPDTLYLDNFRHVRYLE